MITKTFDITGMHCASCAHIIESQLHKQKGVTKVQANFGTEKATVTFDESVTQAHELNDAIKPFGYQMAHTEHDQKTSDTGHDHMAMVEMDGQEDKILFALPLTIATFILMMWDIAARSFSSVPNLPLPMDLTNIILMIVSTIFIFWIGKPYLDGVVRFARYGVANMDTLVGIGTLTAYLYSSIITLLPQVMTLLSLPEYTYFDVVIVVIGFVTLGKYLETRSKRRTGDAIQKLVGLQAKTATVIRDKNEVEIPISEVVIGDIFVVKPGSKIPVDGVIIRGSTSIDESMITGESIPVDKKVEDTVIGATLNKQGSIQCRATKVGSDTMLAQIIHMVKEAQGSKAPIQALADQISAVFVPVVLVISLLSLVVWIFIGTSYIGQSLALTYGILSFVGVLIIACPCALGLATPTAIIVGVGKGAEHGILIKDAESLELLSNVDTLVVDKTGTLTKGTPEVTDVVVFEKAYTDKDLIQSAASVEALSEHPLAQAVVTYAKSKNISLRPVTDFMALEGVGVKAIENGKALSIHKPDRDQTDERITHLQTQGKTVIIVEVDKKVVGLISLSDTVKEGAASAVEALQKRGLSVIMMTGDNALAARYIADQLGIKTVVSDVLPQEKASKIKELQSQGHRVAMAGDGINDAPALVQAEVGIAMATGTDVAIESAGITLIHGDISKVTQAVDLSRSTMRTIRQNLFWAFIYNVIGIPVAAGVLYPVWGIVLNPIFAGLAMALSSVSVVSNSLRLRLTRI
ncbi:MAG: heavy metal translocating P-type ATPase [bacterium]